MAGPVEVPLQVLDADFARQLALALTAAAAGPADALPEVLPQPAALSLLRRCTRVLKGEPTLLRIAPPPGPHAEVVVIGDLHGQLHDLLTIIQKAGAPSEQRMLVFNGDLVDRGAWGLELLLLLCAWKLAAPRSVFLLRGNHESTYCSWVYGFRREVLAKYGDGAQGEAVFAACQVLFSHLPLAAVVAGSTLVVHGGLARRPPRRATRRSLPDEVAIASLADIAASSKGGEDPDPAKPEQRLAADLLWSDPGSEAGVQLGARPGDVGIRFGPDVTEAFLRDNGLRCILRGHEGPDSRVQRPDMQPMSGGWTLDHNTPAGKLYTVFSAPCYPQFRDSFTNLGAVAVLGPPGFNAPRFVQYEAAPRPQATPYYLETEDAGVDEGAEVDEDAELEAAGTAGAAGAAGEAGPAGATGTAGATAEGPGGSSQEGSSSEESDSQGGMGSEGSDREAAGGNEAPPAAGQEQVQADAQQAPIAEASRLAAAAVAAAAAAAGEHVPGDSVLAEQSEEGQPEEGQQPALKRLKLEPLAISVEVGAVDD
ncbi:hypothetical protein COHA_000597 [Chlorella ohadii]|uniref:Serine/threonine-protein phosphatase n=1 Tax=Chlorella ohadii TaxID=2649997 RepID=A0AAD5E071_9CHLO|nr:hypothetical protein COHA_000597 [Chlorella ohadii]